MYRNGCNDSTIDAANKQLIRFGIECSADQLLEQAIELAATEEAWSLAVELLQLQLRLQLAGGGDGARPRQRLEQLTARLDDHEGYWRRRSGGHAAVGDTSDAPAP